MIGTDGTQSWTKWEITEEITCCCSTAITKRQFDVTVNNKLKPLQAQKKAKLSFGYIFKTLSRNMMMMLLDNSDTFTYKHVSWDIHFPSYTMSHGQTVMECHIQNQASAYMHPRGCKNAILQMAGPKAGPQQYVPNVSRSPATQIAGFAVDPSFLLHFLFLTNPHL